MSNSGIRDGENTPKKIRRKYYLVYTLVFCILFFLCFGIYLLVYKKSFFRSYDGFDQHYISFMYLGYWGRSIIRNLFLNHSFSIPLWNQAIGYGADIPTSLAAYIWDPFNWISFFIPSKYAETGYSIMIILKFFACGLSYSIFAFSKKHSEHAVLCGAIIYTFSAVNYVGFYQSFFINPLIIFPLLIIGVDRLFENKKPALYIIMLAISLASYFYFAYMMCILVFAYCIIKLIFSNNVSKKFDNIFRIILRFVLCSIMSAAISAISLLPSLIVMTKAGRLGLSHYLPVIFDKSYYSGIFVGWTTSYNMLSRDCEIGWGVIALICVIAIFTFGKKYWQQKTEFILMTVGLCTPYIGHLMNGMSYTANRWVWAYDLVVALIVTMMIPKLKELSSIQSIVIAISSVIYIIISHGYFQISGAKFETAALLMLLISILCFVFLKITEKQFKILTILISCICVVNMSFFVFSKDYDNEFKDWTKAGKAYSTVMNSGGKPLLNDVDISDGTRFDSHGLSEVLNSSWMYGTSGINFYISVYNNNIDMFHNDVAMNTMPNCYRYRGLDRRSELEALLGVNHYLVDAYIPAKPIGYDVQEAERNVNNQEIKSFKPENNNSLFYTFKNKISYDEYNKLSPYEKQQALMQACVVDNDKANSSIKDLNIDNSSITYNMTPSGGALIDGKMIKINDTDQDYIDLTFPDQNNSEIYLYFDNINYKMDKAETYSISVQGYENDTEIANISNSYFAYTYYCHLYGGKLNWMLNLGYTEQPLNKIRIKFANPGEYNFDDIKIYARQKDAIEENINGLERTAKNVSYISNNRINCDVNLENSETLFSSVPYSNGWKAYDNGKKIKINKTDTAFMSFDLDKGEHHIDLVYRTPGLYAGAAISLIAILCFIFIEKAKKRGKLRFLMIL